MPVPEGKSLILFDGYCHLCSGLVQYILRHDPKARFLFCSLNSPTGRKLRADYQIADSVDSVVLIEGDQAYLYADAVFRIAAALGGVHRIFTIGRFLPRRWNKAIYRWIAARRYAWFGRRKSCFVPDAKMQERFL
ncbi:thiol-disulfide oxidoreductase DCC family protein [Mangrovibacterium marinum]|uniref:Putative DCC family thiol-disulfide oxidoreductase YuxK n=1 Tax=Mangrovibacterium marinum TaxID=1639118 RepID=A0A2T5C5B1_9BACT|nr:DCC1-like thiol-disulfide oxidoreductase family protein [Mangrovibacterium marinum]PTN10095.1 putative DCC family thiol-disulfide oxidoreductase YuxK [Mangrovibacterium marinum]